MPNPAKPLAIIAGVALLLSACAEKKTIDGKVYEPYGLLTADNKRDPGIEYDVVWGNVALGLMFSETIFVPVYFAGFSLFEPVGKKSIATHQVAA